MSSLQDSVQYVKGVGPKRLEALKRLGIETVGGLLRHVPRDYEDRSKITPSARLRVGERATVRAQVVAAEKFRTKRGRAMAHVLVKDGSGTLTCLWFSTRYFREQDFPAGREMFFSGRVDFYRGPQMVSPQHELADEGEALFGPRILPVYPLTEELNQTGLRRITKVALDNYAHLFEDMFDETFLKERKLPALPDAIRCIHYPETLNEAARARRRLAYDELFLLELGMALRRRGIRREDTGFAFAVSAEMDRRIRRRFPFKLTAAQERVVAEIQEDMRSNKPMNRMLQGDVGSGKTVVALYAMLVAVANKFQSAIMAPTEILAMQHYETVGRYLGGSRVRSSLLVGGRGSRERTEALRKVAAGEADLVIGTHALVQGDVESLYDDEPYSVVTAKAVAEPGVVEGLCDPVVQGGGSLVLFQRAGWRAVGDLTPGGWVVAETWAGLGAPRDCEPREGFRLLRADDAPNDGSTWNPAR